MCQFKFLRRRRIEILLQDPVERLHTERTLAHRRKHLNIKHSSIDIFGQFFCYQQNHMLVDYIDIIPLQKEKILTFIIQLDRLSLINKMCIHYNVALTSLPENFWQHHSSNTLTLHQVLQNLSRTNRRELVPVTNHHQPRTGRDRL